MFIDPFTIIHNMAISIITISGCIFLQGVVEGYRTNDYWELIHNRRFLTGAYLVGSVVGNKMVRPVVNAIY